MRTEALKLLGHFVGLHEDARQQVQDAVASLIDDVLPVRSWELPKGTTQAPLVPLGQVLREFKAYCMVCALLLMFHMAGGKPALIRQHIICRFNISNCSCASTLCHCYITEP